MLHMKYSELAPGTLVQTEDGIGILIKFGRRESFCSVSGVTYEKTVLLLINDESKWYNLKSITSLD